MVSQYDLLFEQWKAQLAERDRKTAAIQGNFEELFETFRAEGLVLESAYEYITRAVKAHSPSPSLVKTMWRKTKNSNFKYNSEHEFEEAWVKDIADKANVAFFNVFPVQTKKNEEENEPVIYGSMTAKEYKAQREHADSYPRLNLEELKAKMQKLTYDPMQDLETLLGTNGNSK